MSPFSHETHRFEITAGDHIYTYRANNAFSHHGICVGENKVVHFSPEILSNIITALVPDICMISSSSLNRSLCPKGSPDCGYRMPKSGIVLSCLDCFLSGGILHRFKYGSYALTTIIKRGGISTMAKSDEAELVVYRAMHLLRSGFGDYDLVKNNCEDFALYCKTGLRSINQMSPGGSGQVTGFIGTCKAVFKSCGIMAVPSLIGSLFGIASSVVLAPVGTAIGAGLYGRYRYKSDLGVRKDMVRVDVEDLVPFTRSKAAKEPSKEL